MTDIEKYKKYIGKKVEWVVDYGDDLPNDIEIIHSILWAGDVGTFTDEPFEEHMFLNERGDRWMPLDYVLSFVDSKKNIFSHLIE